MHPGEPVALIGSCAGVEGRFEAGKVFRVKGCPPKVAKLAVTFLHKFNLRSPAFEPVNVAKVVYHSIVELLIKMTIPFSEKISPKEKTMAAPNLDMPASCVSEPGRQKKTA